MMNIIQYRALPLELPLYSPVLIKFCCITNAKPHKKPNRGFPCWSKERRGLRKTVAMGTRPALDWRRAPLSTGSNGRQLTKLLVNVAVERSVGPMHVLVSPEDTVADLARVAVEMYVREGRRPLLVKTHPAEFELHYDRYSLESLNPDEKLISLGSRNFFLCSKARNQATD